MKRQFIWIIYFFVFASASTALAVVTFNSTASVGYYRDLQQNSHLPFYFNWDYSGLHDGGYETSLNLSLTNDFTLNQWSVLPSQATFNIPLSSGFTKEPFRRSRIQLGRQFFTEGFDASLLDGAQIPVYWSRTGGIWLYGGNSHVLDLTDTTSTPIVGTSIFEQFFGANLRAGYAARRYGLSEAVFYNSLMKNFDSIVFSPLIIVKTEFSEPSFNFSQSFTELQVSPFDSVTLSGGHSYRLPRVISSDPNSFVYRVFAISPQENEHGTVFWALSQPLSFQFTGRQMSYNSGTQMEIAHQQEASLSWVVNPFLNFSFFENHIASYGGELWDHGIAAQKSISNRASLRMEFSAAYIDKVNNIAGWAYQVRNQFQFALAPRISLLTWVELERNHMYDFDGRVIAYVTSFL